MGGSMSRSLPGIRSSLSHCWKSDRRRTDFLNEGGLTMNRRELLTSAGAVAGAGLALHQVLAPVKALAADAKPIRIKAIETFNIEMPATQTEIDAGVMNRSAITRVVTESGVKGYPFGGVGGGG